MPESICSDKCVHSCLSTTEHILWCPWPLEDLPLALWVERAAEITQGGFCWAHALHIVPLCWAASNSYFQLSQVKMSKLNPVFSAAPQKAEVHSIVQTEKPLIFNF